MRNKLLAAAAAVLIGVGLSALPALADSTGNFTADIESSACSMNNSTGALTGTNITKLTATIDQSSGNGDALLVTPSLVTGLLTNTNLSSGSTGTGKNKASVTAAVVAHVTLQRPDGTTVAVPPDTCVQTNQATGSCEKTSGVVYDKRFQELSSNIFNVLTDCSASTSSSTNCNLDLVLSTLSAHAFNFVVPPSLLQQGSNTLNVSLDLDCWYLNSSGTVMSTSCGSSFPSGSVDACVGPGTLTVQQVKNFSNDGSITN